MKQNNLVNMFAHRQHVSALSLFQSNNISTNENNVMLYKVGSNHCLIKIKNNRMYRVVGSKLIEILTHNIPCTWTCIAVFSCLTDGNLKALYNSFIGNK